MKCLSNLNETWSSTAKLATDTTTQFLVAVPRPVSGHCPPLERSESHAREMEAHAARNEQEAQFRKLLRPFPNNKESSTSVCAMQRPGCRDSTQPQTVARLCPQMLNACGTKPMKASKDLERNTTGTCFNFFNSHSPGTNQLAAPHTTDHIIHRCPLS